ncbi:MAG: tRNA glutamyl-Q(34) synthetase GluQRS [Mariprofundus sp.]|nr:tRNA glutamyl-Q(34) synthetase GluQRS [Mariprofundus sp.]
MNQKQPDSLHYRTRFAPSPTGLLHVGNAYSALFCAAWAKQHNAELLLRIEDIDHTRCKPTYTDALIEDLHWLGLEWSKPVQYQSQHAGAYMQAIDRLREMQVVYPCFCTRKEIREEFARMASAPHAADVLVEYPGTCRNRSIHEQTLRMQDEPFAWRLNVERALKAVGDDVSWLDASGLRHAHTIDYDIIIGRKDIGFSYHLAVVIDDAAQGITHIIRGDDLRDSTGIHRLLQCLLELPEPVYMHHGLLCDIDGERLAKRHGSTTLQGLRQLGVEAQKLRTFLTEPGRQRWPFSDIDREKILDVLGKRH